MWDWQIGADERHSECAGLTCEQQKAALTEAVTKRASLNGIKTVLRCLERRFCFQSKRLLLLLLTMERLCPSQGGRAEHVQHCLQVVGHGRQADLGLCSG